MGTTTAITATDSGAGVRRKMKQSSGRPLRQLLSRYQPIVTLPSIASIHCSTTGRLFFSMSNSSESCSIISGLHCTTLYRDYASARAAVAAVTPALRLLISSSAAKHWSMQKWSADCHRSGRTDTNTQDGGEHEKQKPSFFFSFVCLCVLFQTFALVSSLLPMPIFGII